METSLPTPPLPPDAPTPGRNRTLKDLLASLDWVLVLTVIVPTALASLYYGVVASDVYVSESRFVVRSPQRPAQTGLGALLQGTALSRSQDDTYSVHDFIRSRDALRDLDDRLKLRDAYSAPGIDFVNRFPGLTPWEDSFEAFFRYYQGRVTVTYDTASSISVLRVQAFDAARARQINEALLDMGERLVNQMNLRSREDLISVAEKEVRVAEVRARQAAASLSVFRADRGVFDPDRQSTLQLQGVARLREELLDAKSQFDQVRQLSPGNPQLGVLQSRVEVLERAVNEESARVTGSRGGLSKASPEFDRLVLEKSFADRQLAATLAALDNARSEAARKQLYLERLVQPHLPDDALEPRRLRSIITTLVVGLVLWGTLSLVLSSIREHAE